MKRDSNKNAIIALFIVAVVLLIWALRMEKRSESNEFVFKMRIESLEKEVESLKEDLNIICNSKNAGLTGVLVAPAVDNNDDGDYETVGYGIRSDDFGSYEDYVEYMKRRVK
ncbi:hypothetical protein J6T21_02885 [Candidatus Saccharibacteria bacterium]|nr:hypothetical protein [Candidatus Saccharibacteria bacterium]